MNEESTYIVDFPPLPPATPRPPAEKPSTIVGLPPPITMGFGHPTAYDAFLADATEEHSGDDMDEDAPPVTAVPATTSKSHLPEFLDMIGAATITTDFLMVSFIPDRIKPEAFAQLMDTITLSVVSATTYHQARTPVYKRPGFLEFFATKPPLWMVLFDAAEQHGSFLL